MIPQVKVVQAMGLKKQRRVQRRPTHRFNLKTMPYSIVPCMIAPVLPGETLANLLLMTQAVSDPIKNRLIGWHKEYYFAYVPLPALTATFTGGELQSMMLDPTVNLNAYAASANSAPLYQFKGGPKYMEAAMKVVVEKWFRDEGDASTVATIDGYPAAQVDQENWAESFKLESQTGDDTELPGVDELEELDILPGFTTQYAQWEMMRDSEMTDLTYEDYLRSYGVDVPKSESIDPPTGDDPAPLYEPELIRMVRQWQLPVAAVDPTDGSVAAAVKWKIAERADKKRFFKYPGFIVGFTVTRAKVYWGNQKGAAVGLLDSPYAWLPAVLDGQPYTSIKETLDSTTDGIFQNQTEDYWVDVKDLFLYGDQLVNHTMAVADNHGLAIPTAAGEKRFLTEAMVKSLFVTTGEEYIREDGSVMLSILSNVRETS